MNYGSYTIEAELGRGGMGVVYRARHTVLGTPAVVKLLLPEFTQNRDIVTRFVNEARAAASLSHDNIVNVLDCNQAPDGVWFIVLELLNGVPLSKWLRGETGSHVARRITDGGGSNAVQPAQIVRVLVQAANALHTAHEHVSEHVSGIVHRDVKPDNIFLVARRTGGRENDLHAVLLDFGIAKLRDAHGADLTRTGATIGTPAYMAPEQLANSKAVDRRADVYALGVVLYEMLTGGWLPWTDDNNETPAPAELYYRQVSEPPRDPRTKNPAISPSMAEVVRRSIACDPRERWSSALEFARALAEAVPADGLQPSGAELLRKYAEELWDPADPMFGHRLTTPPISLADEGLWRPPVSAVSIVGPQAISVEQAPHATHPHRPPPSGAPPTTLGTSAAQSARVEVPPGKSRKGVYGALGAVVGLGGVVAVVVALSGGAARPDARKGAEVPTGTGSAVADAGPPAMTSVAIVTDPPGAAVFIDGEPAGTSPTKAALATGRTIQIRAELGGHAPAEHEFVVGAGAETVRLPLVALVAAPPVDAGTAAATTSRPGGRRQPGGHDTPAETKSNDAPAPGSGSIFDPENIAQ